MILLTGATGIVGKNLLKIFAEEKTEVLCVVRNNNNYKICEKIYPEAKFIFGELTEYETFSGIKENIDIIIHCAVVLTDSNHTGIHKNNIQIANNLIDFAKQNSIKKFFYVSSVEAINPSNDPYSRSKRDIEDLLAVSGIPHTILRSWQIYGETDHFRGISRFITQIKKSRFIPVIGNGKNKMQPVYVGDVANVIYKLIQMPFNNRIYNIFGKTTYTYSQVLNILAQSMNKKIYQIRIPLFILMPVVSVYEKIFPNSFINKRKIEMFLRDEYGDSEIISEELGYCPVDLPTGIKLWRQAYEKWTYSPKNGIFDI